MAIRSWRRFEDAELKMNAEVMMKRS